MIPRLLLIVDDWEALDVYEHALASRFRLDPHPMPKEAILQAQDDPPDAILLDLTLEDWTTAEAIAALRRHPATAETPIAAITGPEEDLPAVALRISRPYDLASLAERVLAIAG